MTELKVTGYVNGEAIEFDARAPDEYEADTDRSGSGAYAAEIIAEDEYGNVSVERATAYTGDEWIEPIWYRTRQDVDRVWYLNNKIAKDGMTSLTAQEQAAWLSGLLGCLNYFDLNRIEIDTRWLTKVLLDYGYSTGVTEIKTDWTMTDMTYEAELERVRSNVQRLIDGYHAQIAELPSSLQKPGWQDINAVERILYEMREMIGRMEQSFRYCGTFNCGQGVVF